MKLAWSPSSLASKDASKPTAKDEKLGKDDKSVTTTTVSPADITIFPITDVYIFDCEKPDNLS